MSCPSELSGLSYGVVKALDCIVVFLKRKRDLTRLYKRMHIQLFPKTFKKKKVEAELGIGGRGR